MRFINTGIRSGKTAMMIRHAYTNKCPIIVTTQHRKELIIRQAQEMCCSDIDVYTVEEWCSFRKNHITENISVDEIEDSLKKKINEYLNVKE